MSELIAYVCPQCFAASFTRESLDEHLRWNHRPTTHNFLSRRLTVTQVRAIRYLRANGGLLRDIGRAFGISATHVRNIAWGWSWRQEPYLAQYFQPKVPKYVRDRMDAMGG